MIPTFSSNVNGPNCPLCNYQLLKYKPWRTNQNNAWGDQEGSGQVFVSKWKEFLGRPAAKQHVARVLSYPPYSRTLGTRLSNMYQTGMKNYKMYKVAKNRILRMSSQCNLSPVALTTLPDTTGISRSPVRVTKSPGKKREIWNLSHFLPKFEFSLIRSSVSGAY